MMIMIIKYSGCFYVHNLIIVPLKLEIWSYTKPRTLSFIYAYSGEIIIESAPSMYVNHLYKAYQGMCWDFVCLLFFVVAILKLACPNTTIDIRNFIQSNYLIHIQVMKLIWKAVISGVSDICNGKGFLRHLGIWRKLDLQLFWTHIWNNSVLDHLRWALTANIYIKAFVRMMNVFEFVYINSWRICLL